MIKKNLDNSVYQLNNSYHVNDFALGLYCPNTLGFKDKINVFNDRIIAFDKLYSNYDHTFDLFSSHLAFSIFLNAFELDRNILNYEQYFYTSLQGYMVKHNQSINLADISKRWLQMSKTYKTIIDIVNNKKYNKIAFDHLCHRPLKYIGNVKRTSYHWHVPIILQGQDFIDIVVILPTNGNFTWYTNLYILSCIDYFKQYNLKTIHYHTIDINTGEIDYKSITLSADISKQLISSLEQFQINFNVTNLFNCSTCPLSNRCTQNQTLGVIQPILYGRNPKEIKILNEE